MVAATGRLVGREEELGAILGLLDEPGDASGVAVLTGEAGIGKTSLWLAAREEAASRGYRVLATRPSDVEAGWSFAGLGDLLGEAAPEVLPGLPAVQRRALETALLLGEPGRAVDERTIAAATLGALRALAGERPVLVAVDDLQWLDPATLAALRFTLARLKDWRLVGLLAVRGEVPDWLRRAVPEQRLRTIQVAGLSLGATHQLLRARLEARFGRPTLVKLWETSRGNPFFALELAGALARQGGTLRVGEELPISTNLDALLRARLDALSPDALEIAQVVTALAEPTVELVEEVVGGETDTAIQEALTADVVEFDGERLRFTHPLLAAAITARDTPAHRRARHARLAELATTTEQRARHLALATRAPHVGAAATLEQAARSAAARGAPLAAAELAEHAYALTPVADHEDAQRRLSFAAEGYFASGDVERSQTLLEQARAQARPGIERAAVLAELAFVIGDATNASADRKGEALLRAALGEAGGDDALGARIHTYLSELQSRKGDLDGAIDHATLAIELATRGGDVELACAARAVWTMSRLMKGDGVQRAELEEAMAVERTLPRGPLESGPTLYLSMQLMWTLELAAARMLAKQLADTEAAREDPARQAFHLRTLALVEWRAGRWELAERYADDASELSAQVGSSLSLALAGAVVDAHLGRVDEARKAAHERIDDGPNTIVHGIDKWILGFVELSLGDASAALEHLRTAGGLLDRVTLEPGMHYELGDLLEALVAAGELEEAEQILAEWEPRATRLDRAWALAILARGRGLLHAARGDQDGAFASFDRALAEHARDADPFQHARTLLALGRTQRRAKRRAAARGTLTEALARFERLGARLWAEQARGELARIGGRTPTGDELTEAEQRVAALVAEGHTNREVAAALFVTVHSVEAALTRVYRKLGVRSRAQLASRWRQAG